VSDEEVLILVSLDVIVVSNSDDMDESVLPEFASRVVIEVVFAESIVSAGLVCEFDDNSIDSVVESTLFSVDIEAIVVSDVVCFDVSDEEVLILVSLDVIVVFISNDTDETVLPEFVSREVLE
jgi:hypothetical protein